MQEQLFKLYHNERDIEGLAEELRVKQKDLERLVCSILCTAVLVQGIFGFCMRHSIRDVCPGKPFFSWAAYKKTLYILCSTYTLHILGPDSFSI